MLSLTVHCSCIRTGKAEPSPVPLEIESFKDGLVDIACVNEADAPQMHEWVKTACSHPDFKAYSEAGFVSIGGAAMMRNEISKQGVFPVLLEKVFENGIHDNYLVLDEVQELKKEIARLDYNKLSDGSDGAKHVIDLLKQAIVVSDETQNPICF